MAIRTARKPKKLTHADREIARNAAASANASLALVRAGKIVLIVVVVAVLVLAVMVFVPRGSSLGGPLPARGRHPRTVGGLPDRAGDQRRRRVPDRGGAEG